MEHADGKTYAKSSPRFHLRTSDKESTNCVITL